MYKKLPGGYNTSMAPEGHQHEVAKRTNSLRWLPDIHLTTTCSTMVEITSTPLLIKEVKIKQQYHFAGHQVSLGKRRMQQASGGGDKWRKKRRRAKEVAATTLEKAKGARLG
ncbi:hypothetical protein ACH5RR_036430 [Cinchona calisaya]|uniref:Uncharacterized protein n=1 Tax=Cinchona calisaya TaxID=153742 RepID=A0ABD2Y366_9GENT